MTLLFRTVSVARGHGAGEMAQSQLPKRSCHQQVLEACGLIRSEKVGRVRTCRIEHTTLQTAEQLIAERRTAWERRLDRLGEYLAAPPDEPNSNTRGQ